MLRTIRQLSIVAVLLCWVVSANAASSPLFARGYTVIPEPQKVELDGKDFVFGNGWRLALTSGVNNGMAAVETLRNDLASRYGIRLRNGSSSNSALKTVQILNMQVSVNQ